MIAEGIAWAADNPDATRELNIGYPTLKAIWGNKLVPSVADRVMASSGYTSQQTDVHEDAGRPHNLWQPVDDERDHGAHGSFDARAREASWQLWANTHRGLLAAGIAVLAAGVTLAGTALGRRG